MSRELSSEILESFGVSQPKKSLNKQSMAVGSKSVVMDSAELNILSAKIDSLKKITDRNKAHIEKVESKINTVVKDGAANASYMQKYIKRLEVYIQKSTTELNAKHAVLAGKVTERGVNQLKIEELIQSHNKIINNFDSKLSDLRKIISEQEMQLLNYKSHLKSLR